jgi:CRISPR/Cas system CSM-associated protein Csm3 (group 7 of RAMP superfamily)
MGPRGLSAVLRVRLTARTPLAIGGFTDQSTDIQAVPRRRAPAGRAMIPGSGFLGAVRSVHEALAGGCLRVLGYRSHVRFDDLLAEGGVPRMTWHLAPLSSTRPSAGQFYLDSRQPGRKRLSDRDARPAATWGSDADKPGPRPIRGRKFYWRTKSDPTDGTHPRGRFREHQAGKLSRRVDLIPAGTVFEGRVRFDNLSVAEYGSLLAALDPRMLAKADDAAWQDTVTSVGGGKPFGFGAVSIDVKPELVQTARMRYLGEPESETEPVPGPEEAVRAFRETVPPSAHAEWERLRHALTRGYVDNDLVWYPSGAGEKGSKGFDESFEFFALTNGVEMTTGDHGLLDLPDPVGDPDAQMLDSPAGQARRGSGNGQERPRRRGGRGRRG